MKKKSLLLEGPLAAGRKIQRADGMAFDREQKKTPAEPSEHFLNAISLRTSSLVAECEYCGTTYYGGLRDGDFSEGEFERYEELAEKEPGKYVQVDGFSSRCQIDGREYVWGCPCNAVRRHEEWLWYHRREITEYFKARSAEEFSDVKQENEEIQSIPEQE